MIKAEAIRDDIRDTLYLVSFNRDIWWHLISERIDRQRHLIGMNRFIHFFSPTISAHYITFVVMLSGLYDKSPDAFSLARLYDLVATSPNPAGRPLAEIRTALDTATPASHGLYLIRSKSIAHRTDKMLTRDLYHEAALTYNGTRDLLSQSQTIFADLSYHVDRTREDFNLSATYDTDELLNAISPNEVV